VAQGASAGATLGTDRTTDVPLYFAGHWVEITSAAGVVKGTWRIKTVGGKNVTLEPNGTETIDIAAGDKWTGVYLFDNVTTANFGKLQSGDPIRSSGLTSGSGESHLVSGIQTKNVTVNGAMYASEINAETLTVNTGGSLRQYYTGHNTQLKIKLSGLLTVNGDINADARGYPERAAYPGATTPGNEAGGAHMGVSGPWSAPQGTTYGSVYRPMEAGGGSGNGGVWGGGVVRIEAAEVVVNGSIRANGGGWNDRGGAGGSVWITTGKISGGGAVEAIGGTSCWGSGAGGAISIEYTEGTLPIRRAYAGDSYCYNNEGGAGSIYTRGPGATYGDLTVDNAGYNAQWTMLPSLGSGVAQGASTGATLATDRTTDVPLYFAGHWVEITSAAGVVKGTWRIKTVSGKNVTLEPNGTETIDITAGDKWTGVYLFDNVTTANFGKLHSSDPIRSSALTGGAGESHVILPIQAKNTTVNGTLYAADITGENITVTGSGSLRQYNTSGAVWRLKLTGVVTVAGNINADGRGYPERTSYPGATTPGNETGGSHIGIGGPYNLPQGTTYGSVYRPMEAGGGPGGGGVYGGGVIRLEAAEVVVNGAIRSNGGSWNDRGGAAGSVWIKTTKISGSGAVEAIGGASCWGGGGGGAVSIEYTEGTLPIRRTYSGDSYCYNYEGGAGSSYVKGPASTYGDLTVDNAGYNGQPTALPSLGMGAAQAGSNGPMLVIEYAPAPYFVSHYVEVTDAAGVVKGIWRILDITATTLTLAPNGSETINIQPGDFWRGTYRFDKITLRNAIVQTADRVLYNNLDKDGPSNLRVNETAPQFPVALRSQIVVDSSVNGDFVTGPAGAVTDPDTPVKVTAKNTRTGGTATVNAAANGSFSIAVAGAAGDTFTVYATDSNIVPLTSAAIPVNGQIIERNTVSAVSTERTEVTGGSDVTGVVRLNYPARSTGAVVSLSSSDPAVQVPASVTVAGGTTSIAILVKTSTVATMTTATITATLGTSSATATLKVLPAAAGVTSVALSETSVEGGTSINATVTLGAPAPTGGATVLLTSSDTRLATVQDVLVVPAGNTSAAFTVTTYRVASQSNVSLSAMYLSSASASATLTACSALGSVAPPASTSLDFTWIDDALPAGSTPNSGNAGSTIDSTQSAAGVSSIHFSGAAAGTRTFGMNTTTTMTVNPTDNLVVYALINPCNPPKQLMLQWKTGTIEYRATWGENRIDPVATPALTIGSLPARGVWTRLEVLAKSIGINAAVSMSDLMIRVVDGEAWIDKVGKSACALATAPPPQFGIAEQVWFDDDLPAGATQLPEQTTPWIRRNIAWDTTQAASGTRSRLVSLANGIHEHAFTGASQGMTVGRSDVIFTYVYLDPCNPPREIMMSFFDGSSFEHRAYWGDNVITLWGSDNSASRWRMGPLPETGKWVRLEVPAAVVGLSGLTVQGAGFLLYDGQGWFDRTGKASRANVAFLKTATQSSDYAPNYTADKAVDGITTSGGVNMSITAFSSQPWWQVDLGAVYPLDQINVYGRTDCCPNQTGNFYLQVSDVPFASNTLSTNLSQSGVSSYGIPGNADSLLSFNTRRTGRYVRIQELSGGDHVTLPEVEVFTPAATQRVNLAGGRIATSSSIWDGWFQPWFALNGVANQIGGSGGSLFHIRNGGDTDAWWQVDLGAVSPISTIDLWTRADQQWQDQVINCYVLVSDAPFTSQSFAQTVAQPGVSVYFTGTAIHPVASIPVNRTGRYVRVQRPGTSQSFSLGEVEIWGQQPTLKPMSKPEQAQ